MKRWFRYDLIPVHGIALLYRLLWDLHFWKTLYCAFFPDRSTERYDIWALPKSCGWWWRGLCAPWLNESDPVWTLLLSDSQKKKKIDENNSIKSGILEWSPWRKDVETSELDRYWTTNKTRVPFCLKWTGTIILTVWCLCKMKLENSWDPGWETVTNFFSETFNYVFPSMTGMQTIKYVTNSMEQIPSWEALSRSASHEMLPKANYRITRTRHCKLY